VLWTQPEDGQIFASFRDDVPASSSLFGASTTSASKPRSTSTSASAAGHTLSASPSPSAGRSASPLTIPARTANQSICAG
jgi:hypothetical protein